MHFLLCILSLITLAWSKPQYTYSSGVSGSKESFSDIISGIDIRGDFGDSGKGSSFRGGNFQPSVATNLNHPSSAGDSHFGPPLVHKQFITFSAPEEHDDLESTKHLVIGRPQKFYRIIFIKAASSSSAMVKLSAEYAPQEEQTIIYILSKTDNQLEVSDIATPAPVVPSEPEIVFIKYQTEEEAQYAQQQIHAEYDKIEGTSEHIDGGIAPQQSFVGILQNGNDDAKSTSISSGASAEGKTKSGAQISEYLPVSDVV